ncbi:precorrin-3B C(17)-methyltransferase [Aestuariivirga sp.]|uniref:precorrin-3B C(17)-methyltransferase n=1 Tax=Aestuariivirga sp. TaxID=2650926 RepID=UPI0039E3EA58
MVRPVIFVLGASALPVAQTLKAAFDGEIHTPDCVAGGDVHYPKATAHLARLFQEQRPIIGLCASGILIRALAPHLNDKFSEPPVIAVAEDGSSVVPLLGGHHGANALARRIAEITGGHAAITTASDVAFGIALDDCPPGYALRNRDDMKAFAARLLGGEKVKIHGDAPWLSALPQSADATLSITITELEMEGAPDHLVYHPQTLTVGVGCERGTPDNHVRDLVNATLLAHGLAEWSVSNYGTLDLKEDEPAIAEDFWPEIRFFTADELNAVAGRVPQPSATVAVATGTPSVSEAAALALANPDGAIIVPKTKSNRATCAVARSPSPVIESRGRELGILKVVGIGPGGWYMRSPQATTALSIASDWVGYGLYLDLVQRVKTDQTEHRFPLGGEEERVRHAIALAKQGRTVALVCSGDAGIYAMAALVYEILDLEPCRIRVEVIPGISAFQAAAAKAGAMIGHDFCCISLSDLLTPWDIIERRVKAAAEGDFVISFYNPRSLKRRDQLERAFAILAKHRPPETPVIIASNLGRPEEKVKIVPFSDFNPGDVDMLTLVMVGSSQSKSFKRGNGETYAYTPRGYARKREAAE